MAFYIGTKDVSLDEFFIRKSDLPIYSLFASGRGDDGQLGTGNTTNAASHVAVGTPDLWKSVDVDYIVEGANTATSAGIKTDGTVWTWGVDLFEKTTRRSVPTRVGTKSDWESLSLSGLSILAINSSGELWGIGQNSNGQLGLGSNIAQISFVQVGNLRNWKQVFTSMAASFAIKTDGSLWVWGVNSSGGLGLGDTVSRSSPVRVGALNNWATICAIGRGERFESHHTIAVKTDGSLWAWGYNATGQLGLGDTVSRSSPVRVGALNDWASVSCCEECTYAIKTDGSLWSWGKNNDGQLGHGNVISRSSPVRVGALNDWEMVSGGSVSEVVAIKTDGSLWGWGRDNNNEMGGIPIEPASSPIRVGSANDWATISLCSTHSLAVRLLLS